MEAFIDHSSFELTKFNPTPNVAYTMAKYGMSLCVLGMAEEFKDDGIAVNALWPQTGIYSML